MTLYRKFGQGVAVLCCVAMFVLGLICAMDTGFSTLDEESGELIYFFEYTNFQASMLVSLAFLVSVVANLSAADFPQLATGIALLPFILTFYEMAVKDINFVLAAVILLLSLVHLAANGIAWYDMETTKRKEAALAAAEAAEAAEADEAADSTDAPETEKTEASEE